MKSIALAVALVAASAGLYAQTHNHVTVKLSEAQWGPAPPFIPAGAQLAVLSGDPSKPAPYSVRLKFPANYAIQAHSHPTDENVVVVSGAVTFGVGGYMLAAAGMNHFAYTGAAEATIVLYGIGPVDFKYVNPADDPRNAKTTTR